MNYKVGDKVKIKSLSWYNKNRNEYSSVVQNWVSFTYPMSEYCGKIATIASIESDNEHYIIDIDGGEWDWYDWMFEDDSLNEADSNGAELKDTIEVIKEKRFQAACSAMQGIVSGLMQSEEWHGWTDDYIAKRAYSLADELLKQGGFTE